MYGERAAWHIKDKKEEGRGREREIWKANETRRQEGEGVIRSLDATFSRETNRCGEEEKEGNREEERHQHNSYEGTRLGWWKGGGIFPHMATVGARTHSLTATGVGDALAQLDRGLDQPPHQVHKWGAADAHALEEDGEGEQQQSKEGQEETNQEKEAVQDGANGLATLLLVLLFLLLFLLILALGGNSHGGRIGRLGGRPSTGG